MKKLSIWLFPFFIIIVSSLYLLPIMQPGLYTSHDGIPQIARIAASIKAVSDGQFPARWAGGLNYGYGNPGLIFFYSLSNYITGIIHFFGFNLQDSYKILMGATFILAPLSFYLWAKQIFKEWAALVSSLFYGLAPYSFLDVFVRGHLAESLAFIFPPLILYAIEKNGHKISVGNILIGGLSYAFLILSHNILSFSFSIIIFGYIVVKSLRDKKLILANTSILLIGLIITVYFWLPALIEAKYINSKLLIGEWYKEHFLKFEGLIYSSWGFGSNINTQGGLSAQIGPLHMIFSVLVFLLFLRKKIKDKLHVGYWFVILSLAIFLSTPLSEFLWKNIHTLQQFQFPWRFTAISSFATAVLTGYFFTKVKNKILILTVLLFLFILSIPMAKVAAYQDRLDSYYFNYPGTAAYHSEATTIWVAGDASSYPKAPITIVSGKGRVYNVFRKSNFHSFEVQAEKNLEILDSTVYFPGWRVFVDNKKVPIEFQDINYRGLITFNVPRGHHFVKVEFGESPIRLFADYVSLIGIVIVGLIFIFRERINTYIQKI
ncbi:MAG: hypothetical protein HYT08_01535 [Candidatus Levybacteria bacterium]|nr:hypothetical protein [Candidatus Levybacteria bacterium]